MKIIYEDAYLLVCCKEPGIATPDIPALLEKELQLRVPLRTVHRLDQPVGGLLVLAKRKHTASDLSQQIREGIFEKEYRAVIHGCPVEEQGSFRDLLYRDSDSRRTLVTQTPGKGVQEAVLSYRVLEKNEDLTRVAVRLLTGRTHQIRVQFASREMPLVGDKRYGLGEECDIALWSYRLGFIHPKTGENMEFTHEPPHCYPWIGK